MAYQPFPHGKFPMLARLLSPINHFLSIFLFSLLPFFNPQDRNQLTAPVKVGSFKVCSAAAAWAEMAAWAVVADWRNEARYKSCFKGKEKR